MWSGGCVDDVCTPCCVQFDTLPITLSGPEDMRPGDLVFVSAIYYNPKSESVEGEESGWARVYICMCVCLSVLQ